MNRPGAVLDYPCPHCKAAVGEPCHSVGGHAIDTPHMRRMDPFPRSEPTAEVIREYRRAVIRIVLGLEPTIELERLAMKDRAIDPRAPWARRLTGYAPAADPSQLSLI